VLTVRRSGPGSPAPASPETWLAEAELARWRTAGAHADAFARKRWLLRVAARAAGAAYDVVQVCPACGSSAHGSVRVGGMPASLGADGDHAVAAVAPSGLVGVDVVVLGSEVPDDVLTAAERSSGGRARLWARKEAALKAVGHGLRLDPAYVEVLGDVVEVAGHRLWLGDADVDGSAVVAWAHDGGPGVRVDLRAT
jgi:4'-phosphopantetheinyl transferase